jgi:hypothetical protein
MGLVSSHHVSYQCIVNVDLFYISVLHYIFNRVGFWYCILPKMHYSHHLSYRGHWRQG